MWTLWRAFPFCSRYTFGQIFGPVAAGILIALWTGPLTRWWEQRKSILRLVLFMLGSALTFNLGRDISLLVLWPVIFSHFFCPTC
jgi:predicted PurR-regulated permease PerM